MDVTINNEEFDEDDLIPLEFGIPRRIYERQEYFRTMERSTLRKPVQVTKSTVLTVIERLETSWKYLWISMYTFHGGCTFLNIIVATAVLHNIVIADGDENVPTLPDELDPHTFNQLLERDEITNI
ncbi:unnamed protein product, partial [Acanthoscelides obtectus]